MSAPTLIFVIIVAAIAIKYIIFRKPKLTGFDKFLIQKNLESEEYAKKIQTNVKNLIRDNVSPADVTQNEIDFYLNMIKSGKYDSEGLKKELHEFAKIPYSEIELLVKNFKGGKNA